MGQELWRKGWKVERRGKGQDGMSERKNNVRRKEEKEDIIRSRKIRVCIEVGIGCFG